MKTGWSKALWLAWHPWELVKLIIKTLAVWLLIAMSYANDAIEDGKK